MRKKQAKQKSRTKSPPLPSTKKLKEYTHTSRRVSKAEVVGISMWPLLKEGYSVSFVPVAEDSLELGDIVVLKGRGRRGELCYKVHRILDRVGPYFLEVGDNAFSASLVSFSDIVGRVVGASDAKGRPIRMQRQKLSPLRDQLFVFGARSFFFAHEVKNRFVGSRKSLMLWRLSQMYRSGFRVLGLTVPVIPPR